MLLNFILIFNKKSVIIIEFYQYTPNLHFPFI